MRVKCRLCIKAGTPCKSCGDVICYVHGGKLLKLEDPKTNRMLAYLSTMCQEKYRMLEKMNVLEDPQTQRNIKSR